MAKFHGKVGFVASTETVAGVWTDTATERDYYGDVIRQSKTWSDAQQVNDNLVLGNRISIVGDDFASLNLPAMRYIIWGGNYYKITQVENNRPRLILSLGGLYNGVKA